MRKEAMTFEEIKEGYMTGFRGRKTYGKLCNYITTSRHNFLKSNFQTSIVVHFYNSGTLEPEMEGNHKFGTIMVLKAKLCFKTQNKTWLEGGMEGERHGRRERKEKGRGDRKHQDVSLHS